jgi:hypothetical protein
MCSSFQFIEHQAFEMSEKIREESKYKFVRVEVSESSNLSFQRTYSHSNGCVQDSRTWPGYITKVILEDDKGALYTVEPCIDGLRFARGEISYKEYRKRQKRESFNILSIFLIGVGLISVVMLTVKWYLI